MSDPIVTFHKTARTLRLRSAQIKDKEDYIYSLYPSTNKSHLLEFTKNGELLQKQGIEELKTARMQLDILATKLDCLCNPYCDIIRYKCYPTSD